MNSNEQFYRERTEKMIAGPSRFPAQYCSKCGKIKTTDGGQKKAEMPGPVTRWNPLKFVCADCLKGEQHE